MLHEPQMIETRNMIVADLQSFLKQWDCFLILLCILISKPFAVIKFGVIGHQFDCIVEILMGLLSSFKRKVSITSVKQSTSIVGIQIKSFIVLSQTFIIKIGVI